MRHRRKGHKLGRDASHRKALYANMCGALFEHGRIQTTESKAKELRPIAEKLNFNLDDSSVVHTIRSVIEARTSTLAAVAVGLLGYGILQLVEATGLWMLKRWGEYFAVVATSLGLPIEIYELTEKITVIRVGALVINVAAVIYLLLTKRLFGLRGGKKAYEEERHEASLLEVEAAGEDRKVRAATGTG